MTSSPHADRSVIEESEDLRALIDASVREAANRLRNAYPEVNHEHRAFALSDQEHAFDDRGQ